MSNAASIESVGLCSTCNNSSFCVYRARRGFDALFCDMFDIRSASSVRGDGYRSAETATTDARAGDEESVTATYAGLCVNCENRENCLMPKPETGVWHCEEYK